MHCPTVELGMEIRDCQSFVELIKAIRLHYKLSQRALAKALEVSPGYVGQWELGMSQPSVEVIIRLCQKYEITDLEYVQRLAYAQRAPEWLRESIIHYRSGGKSGAVLTTAEKRILKSVRRLSTAQLERLTLRVEGWVDAVVDS